MAFFMNRIILYLDKKKKVYLTYNEEKKLINIDPPDEYVDNGVLNKIGEILEKWELKKVTKTSNKLTFEFKLLIRKTK